MYFMNRDYLEDYTMRQLLKLMIVLSVLALFSVPAFAQTATPAPTSSGASATISVGNTVTGTLTTRQPAVTYTLQADAGQAVNITLTSTAFDAYLVLKDASGSTLTENDDSDGTNAGILGFVLPAGGPYQIVAESYGQYNNSGAETGDYSLTVTAQEVNRIEYGQSVQGQLTTAAGSKDYIFTGQAGDVIIAGESSTDSSFDSELYLLDSTGSQLTYNDDSGGTLNSLLGPFTLPSSGSYTLRASTIDGATAGSFTLTLSKTDVTALSFNTPVEVSLTPTDTGKYFTFDGTAGDLVTITADSGDTIDTSLTLNDSSNTQVASDDNGGPGNDPEIYQQLLTTTGSYTVALQVVTPGTGKVTLTLKRTAPPSLDESPQTVTFNSSQTSRAVSFTA